MTSFIAAAAMAVSVLAQQQATVTYRSGERVTADLVGFSGTDYRLRINGRDQRVSAADVASIEMSGGRALPNNRRQSQFTDGRPFVMLNNGQAVDGTLYQIMDRPARIVVNTPNGQRTFNTSDVAGIYMANSAAVATTGRNGRFPGGTNGSNNPNTFPGGANGNQNGQGGRQGTGNTRGTGVTGATGALGNTIVAPGNQQWTSTNIRVTNGNILHFQVTGTVQFSPDPDDRAEAQGAPKRHLVLAAPVPSQPGGSLIGRIDNGQPFWIGNQSAVSMPADGTLFVGINDDNVLDNTGQFNVVITQ